MTARDDNPKLHRIEVERDANGDVEHVRFVCAGGPDAPCHQWPGCTCEVWDEAEHYADDQRTVRAPGHEDVPQDECWIDPWFNETTHGNPMEFAELYDGPIELLCSDDIVPGPVSVEFEGDYMTWQYAEVTG